MAAMHEFAAYGMAGARVDRIAESAAVNKAMIYYHFSSKEELYRETIAKVYREATSVIPTFFDGQADLEEMLQGTADYIAELITKYPEFRSVLMRELAWPRSDIIEMIAGIATSAGLPRRLLGRLEKEIEAGRVRKADPRQLVVSFISMNLGYLMLAPLFERILNMEDTEKFMEKRRKEVVTIFLKGIRSQ
jgi:TetR/AcrR family transcriptional regulator